MEYTENYSNKTERKAFLDIATSKGYSILHENFSSNSRDCESGIIIFTNEIAQAPIGEYRDFGKEIDAIKERISAVETIRTPE